MYVCFQIYSPPPPPTHALCTGCTSANLNGIESGQLTNKPFWFVCLISSRSPVSAHFQPDRRNTLCIPRPGAPPRKITPHRVWWCMQTRPLLMGSAFSASHPDAVERRRDASMNFETIIETATPYHCCHIWIWGIACLPPQNPSQTHNVPNDPIPHYQYMAAHTQTHTHSPPS